MTGLAGTRRSLVKPVALGLGVLLLAVALLIGGWLLFIALRSPPAGFAPTIAGPAAIAGREDGVLQYTVDARSRKDWVYFNFGRGAAVSTSEDALDWDLAFSRTDLHTNSGDTNPRGRGGAVDLGEMPLSEAIPPADGYRADATDDERGLENPALHNWYNYNWTSHIITSKNHTYALKTNTGEVALLTFVSYYCDDGSPGCVTFQYVRPSAP